MTQPKPASAREPAQEDDPPASASAGAAAAVCAGRGARRAAAIGGARPGARRPRPARAADPVRACANAGARAAGAAAPRRRRRPRRRSSSSASAAEPLRHAGRHSAHRARARLRVVAVERPLRLDRQRLCRRRQVADHAAGHRRDRRGSCRRRVRKSRSAIRCSTSIRSPMRSRLPSPGASSRRPRSNSPTCRPRISATSTRSKWARTR